MQSRLRRPQQKTKFIAYDTLTNQNSVNSSFVGGGATFTTTGIKPSPWIGSAGLGALVNNFYGVEITTRYDLEAREGYTDQTASMRFKLPF